MSLRRLILVTNDDGIASPGLRAAVEAVLPLGDVVVVAPAEQQTSMGRSLPGTDGVLQPVPMRVDGREVPAYALRGSPAYAAMYGILLLARERKPDLVVSGVNYGENLGTSTTVSGTIGAAFQAAAMGVRALAVSLETDPRYHFEHGEADWRAAVHFTRYFAGRMLACDLPFDVDVLKVDIPQDATVETPWRVTRQSRHTYYGNMLAEVFNDGRIGGKIDYHVAVNPAFVEPDSDIYAFLRDQVVSVTPLSLDCTSRVDLAALQALLSDTAGPCRSAAEGAAPSTSGGA